MAIRQPNSILGYIETDLEAIKGEPRNKLPYASRHILDEKDKFKERFASKLDIIILKHMYEAIKKMNKGQGTILDPAKSKEKKATFDYKEKKIKEVGRQDPVLENAIGKSSLMEDLKREHSNMSS